MRKNVLFLNRMICREFHLFRIVGLLAASVTTLVAGNFVPPAEGPIAFRRDQIPLDADSMASLSRILVNLTQALDTGNATNRRTAAQMLALSTALDPGNSKARNLIAEFQRNGDRENAEEDAEQIKNSQKRVWKTLEWLETPEAGSQGQALAACLSDVIAISDPQHPKAAALRAAGERGAWQGWIPQLAAYEPQAEVMVMPEEPKKKESVGATFLLDRAQVHTVIWKADDKGDSKNWIQASAPLQMVAQMSENEENEDPELHPNAFQIAIAPRLEGSTFRRLSATLVKLLKTQTTALPAGLVTIHIPDLEDSGLAPKRQSISAAAAVLASAAVSGCEPDATILGVVDEKGSFELSRGFWSQLQALGPGNGRRLILPSAAAEYLPSMLALERPQLFFDYEILLASSFQDLLKLSAKIPDQSIEKSIASFREIREKAGTQPLGQYVANPHVRKRLVDIVIDNPNHLSAKMLAIQGTGNRPTYIPRIVLASELRRAIEPMEWLVKQFNPDLEPAELQKLGATSDLCRSQVDRLARYTAKDDRELLGRVEDMVIGIRTLDRASRTRSDSYDIRSSVISAHSALVASYRDVAEELANLIGDTEQIPAP
jgi:hypothetical protein